MAIVISGNGIDMGNNPVSNVNVGSFDNNAATVDYVKNNGDVSAVTGFSQISGVNEISGIELTNNIHDVFGDGSAVATYQLNGNANDLGGTYNGVTTNVNYEAGKFGQSAVFNGTSSKLQTTAVNSTNLRTLSLWVNINQASTNTEMIASFGRTGSNNAYDWFLASWNNTSLAFGWGTTAGDFSNGALINVPKIKGEWVHLCFIISAPTVKNSHELYINGNKQTLIYSDNGYPLPAIQGNCYFGHKEFNPTHYFNGSMDQIRIFNRALTAQEVNTLYLETTVPEDSRLNINQGTFIYPKGLGARGYIKSSGIFTGTVDVSAQTDGWKYVAKDENGNFSFYTDKPTIGKKSATLYLKEGKLYKSSDDTEVTPVSFLSNKVRIASGVAVELAPSDISKTVTESLEAGSYFGKNAIVAYASIDMTTTPPTILDSYNIASVIRSSNGVGKVTLVNPTDKDTVTAICGSNSVAGTITSTTKNEVSFATGVTNYAKTSVIVIGGKF